MKTLKKTLDSLKDQKVAKVNPSYNGPFDFNYLRRIDARKYKFNSFILFEDLVFSAASSENCSRVREKFTFA